MSTLDKWEVLSAKGKIHQEIKILSSVLGNKFNDSTLNSWLPLKLKWDSLRNQVTFYLTILLFLHCTYLKLS